MRCGHEQPRLGNDDPYLGRVVADRYEIISLIGEGGMGRVYRAIQRSLDRPVAVKFVHTHVLETKEAVARFMVEAKAASRLNHPNVVAVYDFGTVTPVGSDFFLAMEYIAGHTLSSLLSANVTLPISRVVSLIVQVLAGLGEAHHQGIAHRDVKPENIMLETRRSGEEVVKVIDFGVARIAALPKSARVTMAGQVFGTPSYMAPEQALAREAGPSADLYSVGVMLFELLTGQLPFQQEALPDLLKAHVCSERPNPSEVAPHRNIPPALAALCMRAMAIDPKDRFADATTFAKELHRGYPKSQLVGKRAFVFPGTRRLFE